VENCQTVVNCAYVTGRGHALSGFRLCLPKAWCRDRKRRERAQIPRDVQFQAKTGLATGMVTAAVRAAVPFGWAAGDEVCGRSSKLRTACQDAGKG
jgi:SRSO17 transposase